METTLTGNKTLRNVCGETLQGGIGRERLRDSCRRESKGPALDSPLFNITPAEGAQSLMPEGSRNDEDTVIGSYIHGLFDEAALLDDLLKWAGLDKVEQFDYTAFREQQIERLADEVEAVLPFERICELLSLEVSA